jgi:hypothetical protein
MNPKSPGAKTSAFLLLKRELRALQIYVGQSPESYNNKLISSKLFFGRSKKIK